MGLGVFTGVAKNDRIWNEKEKCTAFRRHKFDAEPEDILLRYEASFKIKTHLLAFLTQPLQGGVGAPAGVHKPVNLLSSQRQAKKQQLNT